MQQQNPLRTSNLRVETSPQYDLAPVRLKVTCPVATDDHQQIHVSVPRIHFPPDGAMMIALETVTHKPGDESYLYLVGPDLAGRAIAQSGFLVDTRGLAEGPLHQNGITDQRVIFTTNEQGVGYDRVQAASEANTTMNNELGTTGDQYYGYKLYSEAPKDNSFISHVFAHDTMQFTFGMRVVPRDAEAVGDNVWVAAKEYGKSVEVTFLIYPNPFWKQRY